MDRRTQKTKTAIQNAYFSLLTEKEPARITVSEIARRANIDRKTFYLHYETADDIVEEFAEDKIGELLALLEKEDFFLRPFDAHLLFGCLNELIMQDLTLYRSLAGTAEFDFVWTKMQEALVSATKEVFAEKVEVPAEEWDVYAVCPLLCFRGDFNLCCLAPRRAPVRH